MNNKASRKGIGAERSELDYLRDFFTNFGIQFTESSGRVGKWLAAYPYFGRRAAKTLAFETTTLYFDAKGRYVGREYMSRDECDYFRERTTS